MCELCVFFHQATPVEIGRRRANRFTMAAVTTKGTMNGQVLQQFWQFLFFAAGADPVVRVVMACARFVSFAIAD